ncbi:serine/threonine-protein kinase 33 isoform X1 [Nerophis ophidion]|uniref:serine/threonine-protein kinase 33 isoform X1 n=2 Tax=Nerophis ophidion TaxID=159077 RepID=UPI002ADFFDAA|nr:serine/threonine-protein kinase 33 isoform X1 [Nerophis ophidion]XP_061739266.1 serine/threonine-protein kinase 33 isoform X1 [Nerophis ophidion]XP_061739271.1 serine/threonine-protein kinase 33 isoform X1 [Nerophis ophidion]
MPSRRRFTEMAEAAFSGLGKNTASRGIAEREVPHIRLVGDADVEEIYIFGKKLGHGSYGVVYAATHIKTQSRWAIKTVCKAEPGSTKIKMLEQEIKILKHVDHPHILRLEEIYETAQMTYLVTELCVGGELKQALQQKKLFPEEEAKHIIGCLADAITYLHKKNIMHRDLKLENILVKNSLDECNGKLDIKVADFGLSVKTLGVGSENILFEVCGTPIYMAPEMMSQRGYTHWIDMWSVGVITYILLCGEPPFVSKTKETRLKEIKTIGVRFSLPIWDTISDAAKTVVTCLLKANPAYRMSANQLRDNSWITGDTNTPAMPLNALEMMHNFHEQEKSTQEPEESQNCDSVAKISSPASSQTESNSMSHSDLSDTSCTPSTSTKLTKKECSSHHLQDKCKSSSSAPNHPTTPQTGGKPCKQSSVKSRKSQRKKDVSTVQKAASHQNSHRSPPPTVKV